MKSGKRKLTFNRIVALVLVLVTLPISDFSQAFAVRQVNAAGLNSQQTVVSQNDVTTKSEKSVEGHKTEKVSEKEPEVEVISSGEVESLDYAGASSQASNTWERVTREEIELIQQAVVSQYDDLSIDDTYVLEEDMEVANLYVIGGSLDLNGHTLVVYGDFIQTAGDLLMNGGKLVVGRDYRIQTREENPEWKKVQNGNFGNVDQEVEQYIYGESTGKLTMTNNNDYLVVCGSFVTDSTVSHANSLTAGTMEVMGDFAQLCTQNTLNFVATKEHKVVFNGTEEQSVLFSSTAADKSRFANMEIGNVEPTGTNETQEEIQKISFSGIPYVLGQVVDYKSHVIEGKIGIGSTTKFMDGYYGGSVSILQAYEVKKNETITISGDVDLSQNCSIYGIFHVGGNVKNTSAGFSMEGGSLYIGKDFTITNGYPYAFGVKMSHEDDYVLVNGNFDFEPVYTPELSNGILEIKQNVVIKNSFFATGNHKTVLSGDSKQTISIATGKYFNILELKNSSEEGVYSESVLSKSKLIRNGSKLSYGTMEGSFGYTLEDDEVIEGDFVLLDDTLDLNGHSLRIKGNLIQVSGVIMVNGGLLTVDGDYMQLPEAGVGCNGYLEMTNEKDYVVVNGNMHVETTADTTGKLTNGVLEIKGNFIQKKTAGLNNFKATDEHTLLLSGEEVQTFSMEYTAADKSQINNLEIKNAKGIQVENSPYIAGLITASNNPVSGEISIGSNTAFASGIYMGDVRTIQDYTVNQDLMIGGNLVTKRLLIINKRLEVGKNLIVDKKNEYFYGIQMTNEEAYILVKGDFVYNPYYESEISAGTLEVKGNLQIDRYFHATGTHKTILSGDAKQTITIADGMYFNILELQNYSEEGVYSEKAISKTQLIRNGCKISYGTIEGSYGETLQEDKVVEGDYILLDDTLDLNGYSLTVKGDFIQSAGEVYVNGGTLIVEGDYRQQSREIVGENAEPVYGVSSGLLHMDREEDYVQIKGSMYIQTTAVTTGKLTAGILEVQGDFIQKKTTVATNYNPSGSHTLVLAGTSGQTVELENSSVSNANISNLEIRNTTDEGITFVNNPYVAGTIKTSNGQTINGSINVGTNTVFADGYYVGSICIVEETTIPADLSLEIAGNMEIKAVLNMLGNLTVRGDFFVNPARYGQGILMQKGKLYVENNLIVNPTANYTYGIQMKNEEDYIFVGGNFVYNPYYEHELSAGTLEIQGDVDIRKCFHAKGTHKTILSGDSKQTVTMASGMYFNILELQNYSDEGVYSETAIQKNLLIRNGCKLTYGSMEGCYGYVLEQDEVIDDDFILLDDTLDLNGHTLTIKGDFIHMAGEVYVNGGTLIVEGDYRQQSKESEGESSEVVYGVGSGLLHMDKEEDYVQIKGNMYVQTTVPTTEKIVAGVLEVHGDFIQKNTTVATNYNPSGSHTLVLAGTSGQRVELENSSASNVHIANLEIRNTTSEGITFVNSPYVAGSVKTSNGQSINGNITVGDSTVFADGYYAGSICIVEEMTIPTDMSLEIAGNIEIKAALNLIGNLTVRGDFFVNPAKYRQGILMQKGKLYVENNLIMNSTALYTYGIEMKNEEDYIFVGGNFAYNPYYECELSAGTLEIQGDVDIRKSFHAKGTHKTILSGDSKQTVTMASEMYFNILELRNTSEEGVYSEKVLQKEKLVRNGCKLTYGNLDGTYGYILEQDEIINGDFILLDDTLDLNGHTLTIKGDFIQCSGELYVNGGALIVEGDYRQQSKENSGESSEVVYAVGSGLLHMDKDEDYVQINGNLYIQTTMPTIGKLTAGVLEVQGDFIQKKTTVATNYNPSGSHTLVLAGTSGQTVELENSSASNAHIANLDIRNTTGEGITFVNNPYVAGTIKTSNGQTINGSINVGTNTVFADGYYVGSICTVEAVTIPENTELEIGGNLAITQPLYVKGNLVVEGNMEVSSKTSIGGIVMQKGNLVVEKDLSVNVIEYSSGIEMKTEEDYIFVGGNFAYNPYYERELSAGTLEIQGDVDIRKSFHAKGTHKTILSGDSKQTVTMASGMYFNILELKNTSDEGVYSETAIPKKQLIRNGCKLTYGDTEGIYGFTLQEDYIAEGDLILLEDVLDLNGHTLTVRGNLIQAGGEILLNGGKLIVEGDYRQQTRKLKNGKYVYEAGNGYLTMNNEKDQVQITGDFIIQTTAVLDGHYTKGVLTIGGNFQQIGSNSFVAGVDHTLCFGGDSSQKIIQETISVIGNLKVENTSKMGVVLGADMTVLGNITDKESKMSGTGNMLIKSLSQLTDGNCGGNIKLSTEYTLENDINIEGTLTVGGTLKLGTRKLQANACVVNGTLYVENGTMILNSYLNVSSNARFVMTGEGGYAFVNGDVNFASNYSHSGLLTQGTLEVRGNFTQKSAANFVATENHTTVLSKKTTTTGSTKVQTISFSHPGKARFHRLVLKKNLTTGYIFNTTPEKIADEVVYEVTDENPPSQVGYVTVGNVTCTAITLCYEPATDDTGVVGYEIYRNGRKIAVTAGLSYTDTGLTSGTNYTYSVYAFDLERNLGAASEEVEVATLPDEQAPDKVTSLAITSSTGSAVTLSWKPSVDNVKTTSYTLYRDGELVAENITKTTYKDTGLKKNKIYVYTITATDESGNISEMSEEVHGAVTMPKITKVSPEDYATIGGTQVTMNVRFSATGNSTGNQVVMEYYDDEKDVWNLITPTPLGQRKYNSSEYYVSYTWDISSFEEDKEIDVRITLIDEDGNSQEKIVTYSLDRTAPKPPKNLEIKESNGTLTLSWDRSVSADLAGTIIRRQAQNGNFEIIKEITDANVTWYTDTAVETGISYTYTLQCYDKFGQKAIW